MNLETNLGKKTDPNLMLVTTPITAQEQDKA